MRRLPEYLCIASSPPYFSYFVSPALLRPTKPEETTRSSALRSSSVHCCNGGGKRHRTSAPSSFDSDDFCHEVSAADFRRSLLALGHPSLLIRYRPHNSYRILGTGSSSRRCSKSTDAADSCLRFYVARASLCCSRYRSVLSSTLNVPSRAGLVEFYRAYLFPY